MYIRTYMYVDDINKLFNSYAKQIISKPQKKKAAS